MASYHRKLNYITNNKTWIFLAEKNPLGWSVEFVWHINLLPTCSTCLFITPTNYTQFVWLFHNTCIVTMLYNPTYGGCEFPRHYTFLYMFYLLLLSHEWQPSLPYATYHLLYYCPSLLYEFPYCYKFAHKIVIFFCCSCYNHLPKFCPCFIFGASLLSRGAYH